MKQYEKIETANSAPLFKLVTRKPHRFGAPRRISASQTLSGHEQIERACITCGLVRITIMHGREDARAYRWGDAPFQFDWCEPECGGIIEAPKPPKQEMLEL